MSCHVFSYFNEHVILTHEIRNESQKAPSSSSLPFLVVKLTRKYFILEVSQISQNMKLNLTFDPFLFSMHVHSSPTLSKNRDESIFMEFSVIV